MSPMQQTPKMPTDKTEPQKRPEQEQEPEQGKPRPAMPQPPQMPQGLKIAVEMGPLIGFFIVYLIYGLMPATAFLIVAVLAGLAISYSMERKIAVMPVVTAVIVTIFGGLTLYLNDATFIKMKPTIVYLLMAGVLLGGLMTRRPLIKFVFGQAFQLNDNAWRVLTIRWTGFFIAMALLNEYVWRSFSESTWVAFKVWGFLPLTILFTMLQMPLILKNQQAADPSDDSSSEPGLSERQGSSGRGRNQP